jgi:thiol-disulfide isomerase/thioredoxin
MTITSHGKSLTFAAHGRSGSLPATIFRQVTGSGQSAIDWRLTHCRPFRRSRIRKGNTPKCHRYQTVSLSEFQGRPVILAFYPADWSPVCSDQMALYNQVLAEFQKHGAELMGIRLTVSGAIPPSPRIATSIVRSSQILSRKVQSHAFTVHIARRASPREPCSLSTKRERSAGAIVLQWPSILARMESCRHSKHWRSEELISMQLKENVTPEDHSQGAEDAKVTLIEYGDYECSHCGAAYPVAKRLQERFGVSLRFVFRNFPLTEAHPMAEASAEAAEYAATKDKFWQIHDGIYDHQTQLSIELLWTLATQNGLDAKAMAEALKQHTFQRRVKKTS